MAETIHRQDIVKQAVSELHETLDPEHTLPDSISFEIAETYDFTDHFPRFNRERVFIQEHGEPIGRADLVIRKGNYDPDENYAHFDGIKLHHSYQGKGIGLATYMWAIERSWEAGVPFRTQTVSQSPDAKQLWEFLASNGVAVCEEPFELDYQRDGVDRFMGKYVVPLPKI